MANLITETCKIAKVLDWIESAGQNSRWMDQSKNGSSQTTVKTPCIKHKKKQINQKSFIY